MPLWDTTWWITLRATRGDAPLARLEYSARFTGGTDPRSIAGGFDIGDPDRDDLNGRIVVTCPARPDYEKKLRVKLRVSDANGATSEWVEMTFPVRNDPNDPVIATMPVSVAPKPAHTNEMLGSVEIEADDHWSIAQVKEALKRQAREKGGDAAVNFRMVSSSGDHVTFAADVVRSTEAPHPTPTSTPAAAPDPDGVIGEIVMPSAH